MTLPPTATTLPPTTLMTRTDDPRMTEQNPADPSAESADATAAAPVARAATPVRRMMRASAVMASGSIVSRILGFVRNGLMSLIVVNASPVSSAVSAANFLPNSIWIFIGGGVLNAILVPAIVRATKQADRGSDYVSRLMTLVVLCSAVLTAVCIAAVPLLVRITSGDLGGSTLSLAIALGYWMMPQIMFSALYVMAGQLLNAHESFGPYQWAPVLNNVVGILGALVFMAVWGTSNGDPGVWTTPMILALAAFNVGGSAAQVAFLWIYVRRLGLHLRPRWGFRGLGLGKLSRIGLWTLAMLGVSQLGIYATRWATSGAADAVQRLHEQGRTAEIGQYPGLWTIDSVNLAFMIPQGIIAVSLVTAAFPGISRSAADHDHAGVLRQYARTSRLLAVPMMLATVVFIALAGPIMWVIILGSDPVGARANGWVLAGYMLGLVPFAATYLVKRVFYAYEDGRTPFLMQIPNTLASLVAVAPILLLVDPRWAAAAATTASALGNLLCWVVGVWLLNRRIRATGTEITTMRTNAEVMVKLLIAGALSLGAGLGLMALLQDAVYSSRPAALVICSAIGVLMTAVFAATAWLLRVQELRSLADQVLRRVSRRRA